MSDKFIFERTERPRGIHVNISVDRLGKDEPKPAKGAVIVKWPEKAPGAADAAGRVQRRLGDIFGSAEYYERRVDTEAEPVNIIAHFEMAAADVDRLQSLWERIVAAIEDDG